MNKMGMKIISDGTPMGTKVIDSKTGAQIGGVFFLKVTAEVGEAVKAEIHCYVDTLDIEVSDDGCEFIDVNPLCHACKEDAVVDATELGDDFKKSVKAPTEDKDTATIKDFLKKTEAAHGE